MLAYRFKIIGGILVMAAFILSFVYFIFDFRIPLTVFIVYADVPEIKIFSTLKNNFADELILITYLIGFFFLLFSREKNEKLYYYSVRFKAILTTMIIYLIWLLFGILFIYGDAFTIILVVNVVLPLFIYLIVFYSFLSKEKRRRKHKYIQHTIDNI